MGLHEMKRTLGLGSGGTARDGAVARLEVEHPGLSGIALDLKDVNAVDLLHELSTASLMWQVSATSWHSTTISRHKGTIKNVVMSTWT